MSTVPSIPFHDLPAQAGGVRRAAVVGASLAGLLAARVLADHYDEVWLFDRDELPQGDEHRRATPHTRHAHGLLAGGRRAIEALLPGITDQWVAAGGSVGDLQQDVAFYGGHHRFASGVSGETGIAVGRPVIEGAVRRRVLALPQVRACTGVDVRGLLVDSRQRVSGLCLESLGGGLPARDFHAALVVDASGRGSRLPAWLREIGFPEPAEERVPVDLRYLTCYFEREPTHAPGLEVVLCSSTPDHPRIGVMIGQEGKRWVVTLGGYGSDAPAPGLTAFIDRALQLPSPEIAAVVRDAKPVDVPMGYRFSHSQRRRYERLPRFPEGLLVMGDAICSFNPIYGQGMSVAALQAQALGSVLRAGKAPLAREFLKRASRIIDTPWSIAVGADLAIPAVPGERPLPVRLINRYMQKVFVAAEHDPAVALAFLRVAHLLAEPPSLMKPAMLWRVWRGVRRSRRMENGGFATPPKALA
jgi:2-polyprenyl-6-methoxyphenol hydroxylase-like FAD-dependent oxidoreductase